MNKGYKDAAAVIAGSTLESHLRKLCLRNSLDLFIQKKGKNIPKKTNLLKDELFSSGVISKTNNKQLTVWLDIRNNSAHGHYDEYSSQEVDYLIQGIRNFIEKYPA